MKIKGNSGFTLIELLIAIALGLILLAGLYKTFRTQHDTYIVQDQVAAMQQNLRAAMYLITRDLQMAGWYTNFDRNNRNIDWNDLDGDRNPLTGQESSRPLLIAHNNNSTAGDDVRAGTDMLIIAKAADGTGRTLGATETAGGTSVNVDLGLSGLDATDHRYGLLVKSDLRTADLFIAGASPNPWSLTENYLSGDTVFRTDIIIYKVDETVARPTLVRGNLGNWNGYQPVAENIDNMQVSYQLSDGSWVNTLSAFDQPRVRAVEVTLVGRTAFSQRGFRDTETYTFTNDAAANYTPNDQYRRKTLSTTVKTRNVGL